MSDFKSCKSCQFKSSAWHCCSHYEYCKRIEELESKEIALQKAIAETVVQLDNSQLSLIHADEQITELEAELDSYKMRQGLIPIHIASPEEDNE